MTIPKLPSINLSKTKRDEFVQLLLKGVNVNTVLNEFGANLLGSTDVFGYAQDVTLDIVGRSPVAFEFSPKMSHRSGLVAQSFLAGGIDQALGVSATTIRDLVGAVRVGAVESDALAAALDATVGRAQTVLNTSLAGLQRQVSADVSKDLLPENEPYFKYSGPSKDSKTRGYCYVLRGMAVTLEGLRSSNNNQSLDPGIYLGGWNCRDSLTPILRSQIEDQGIHIATEEDYQMATAAAMT